MSKYVVYISPSAQGWRFAVDSVVYRQGRLESCGHPDAVWCSDPLPDQESALEMVSQLTSFHENRPLEFTRITGLPRQMPRHLEDGASVADKRHSHNAAKVFLAIGVIDLSVSLVVGIVNPVLAIRVVLWVVLPLLFIMGVFDKDDGRAAG